MRNILSGRDILGSDADTIRVWRWDQAPQCLKDLSQHGGDEDWVALIPPSHGRESWIPWAESGTRFGYCHVSTQYVLIDGSEHELRIGSHA